MIITKNNGTGEEAVVLDSLRIRTVIYSELVCGFSLYRIDVSQGVLSQVN